MGLRFRKSFKLPGGGRINLSQKGVGWSWGIPGYRITRKACGGKRRTFSIPKSGLSYVKETAPRRAQRKEDGPSFPIRKRWVFLCGLVLGIMLGYAVR